MPKQFSSVIKSREPAKSEVTRPTTSSQPALALSRADDALDHDRANPCWQRPHDVVGDQGFCARSNVAENEAGDGEHQDQDGKDGEEEVIGEQAGEVEDPVVVDLDPERGDGGDTASWRVAMLDRLVQIAWPRTPSRKSRRSV